MFDIFITANCFSLLDVWSCVYYKKILLYFKGRWHTWLRLSQLKHSMSNPPPPSLTRSCWIHPWTELNIRHFEQRSFVAREVIGPVKGLCWRSVVSFRWLKNHWALFNISGRLRSRISAEAKKHGGFGCCWRQIGGGSKWVVVVQTPWNIT